MRFQIVLVEEVSLCAVCLCSLDIVVLIEAVRDSGARQWFIKEKYLELKYASDDDRTRIKEESKTLFLCHAVCVLLLFVYCGC